MGKGKSMGVNAILSGVKTILSVIFPLITFPYISRVLSLDDIGKYNFSVSVMTYVSLFAALGVNTYAIRECSKVRDNRDILERTASEIFTINIISTVLSYTALMLLLAFSSFFKPYKELILILSINVAFTTIGCEWIYSVFEDYLYITVRSFFAHIVSLILLFIMVRKSDDVIPYAVVTVISSSGSNLLLYFARRKKYFKIKFTITNELKHHIKPIMTMFANTVTTSIYVNSDIIILGILTSDRIVGLYSASTKIYTIVKNVLAAVITVSIPKLSNYWGNNDIEKYNSTCSRIFMVLLVIGAPSMIGLSSLSKFVILFISGEKYIEATDSLVILSVSLFFSVFAWFYKSCVLIPTGNENKILRATLTASMINIILNFILIPFIQQNAAALTTLIAEALCLGFSYHYGNKYYKLRLKIKDILSVAFGCLLIFACCKILSILIKSTYLVILISITISVILYFGVLVIFKNTAIMIGMKHVKNIFIKIKAEK